VHQRALRFGLVRVQSEVVYIAAPARYQAAQGPVEPTGTHADICSA
jgi:hypothetical protein